MSKRRALAAGAGCYGALRRGPARATGFALALLALAAAVVLLFADSRAVEGALVVALIQPWMRQSRSRPADPCG